MQLIGEVRGRLLDGLEVNERKAVLFVLTFAVCLLSARFGAVFYTDGHSAPALIWLPAGVSLALIYLEGYYLCFAVALGIFGAVLMGGTQLGAAIVLAVANTLVGGVGAYFLHQFKFDSRISRLRDATILIAVTFLVSAIVPTVGVLATWATSLSPASVFTINWDRWGPWWLGEFLSVLVVAPLLIRWLPSPRFHRSRKEWIEFAGSFALLIAVEFMLFWTPENTIQGIPLTYLIFIPLIWMAFRIGPRGMTFALFLAPAIAILGTIFGFDAATGDNLGRALFLLEVFFAIISVLFLLFAALAQERKDATIALVGQVTDLEQALTKISREDEAKSEFLAILAHELRNPLAPVLSSLELLREGGVTALEAPHLITLMESRVRTMGRLLDDLLDISRISQKKFSLRKERVILQPILESAVLTAKDLMNSRNHSLTVKIATRPIELVADPVRLEQVIVNLLTNAAKYTPTGGQIHFEAKKNPSSVSFIVRDSGIGIAPEMLSNIFEPFLQVAQGKASNTGLGIGLFLTKNLVKMHEGYIEARSPGKGKGSEFFVYLPLADLPVQAEQPAVAKPEIEAPAAAAGSSPERKTKILLVDDNEAAAQSLGKLLTLKGYDVMLAYTGAEALNKAPQFKPDGIILDIGLPDMEGYEVASRLRETPEHKDTLLVALTGYGQEDDKSKAKKAGFNHHLTKPVGLKELEPVLGKISKRG